MNVSLSCGICGCVGGLDVSCFRMFREFRYWINLSLVHGVLAILGLISERALLNGRDHIRLFMKGIQPHAVTTVVHLKGN